MEYIGDENRGLKLLLRENDNRISYLQNKLEVISRVLNLTGGDTEHVLNQLRCYMCNNICLYDEIKCDCNTFCQYTICRPCFMEYSESGLQSNIRVCQYNKCDRWICNNASGGDFLYQCNGCAKYLCQDHYNNTNLDLKNWNCKDCCQKTLKEYRFEEV